MCGKMATEKKMHAGVYQVHISYMVLLDNKLGYGMCYILSCCTCTMVDSSQVYFIHGIFIVALQPKVCGKMAADCRRKDAA